MRVHFDAIMHCLGLFPEQCDQNYCVFKTKAYYIHRNRLEKNES